MTTTDQVPLTALSKLLPLADMSRFGSDSSRAPGLLKQRTIWFVPPWDQSSMSSLGITSSKTVFGLRTINKKYVFLRKFTVQPPDIQEKKNPWSFYSKSGAV